LTCPSPSKKLLSEKATTRYWAICLTGILTKDLLWEKHLFKVKKKVSNYKPNCGTTIFTKNMYALSQYLLLIYILL
jgi:hypothetical protein